MDFHRTTKENRFDIQYISFFYHNFFNKKIKRDKGKIIPFCRTVLKMKKTSSILLNGSLRIGVRSKRRMRRTSVIRLWENATLKTNGLFSLFYDCDIIVMDNATLEFGNGASNLNLKIRCAKSIKLGNDVNIAHDVTIMDSNFHKFGANGTSKAQKVEIGNHVFIGSKSIILKGVTIGDGVVIAAGSVVTKDIPKGCLAGGVPAKVIKENIEWKM